MPAPIDLTGRTFGRLTALFRETNSYRWVFRCECGNKTTQKACAVKTGRIVSCGCYNREKSTKHGACGTRLHNIFRGMHDRCSRKTHAAYHRYGGRGIKVCGEWRSFEPFRDWALAHSYADDLTIDRVNNDGDYTPSNCRWATAQMQATNRVSTSCPKKLSPEAVREIRAASYEEWGSVIKMARKHGVSRETIARARDGVTCRDVL